ncbi:unnamed protein product [Phytophthora lilii]|uniref:Unnamed protein product n=1 Tax=Phytophthora lilii TaxID=2077276 RepID=A0A9W6WSM4_9STRA|nr:unnamed protein product [Phytophthora lilii]
MKQYLAQELTTTLACFQMDTVFHTIPSRQSVHFAGQTTTEEQNPQQPGLEQCADAAQSVAPPVEEAVLRPRRSAAPESRGRRESHASRALARRCGARGRPGEDCTSQSAPVEFGKAGSSRWAPSAASHPAQEAHSPVGIVDDRQIACKQVSKDPATRRASIRATYQEGGNCSQPDGQPPRRMGNRSEDACPGQLHDVAEAENVINILCRAHANVSEAQEQ